MSCACNVPVGSDGEWCGRCGSAIVLTNFTGHGHDDCRINVERVSRVLFDVFPQGDDIDNYIFEALARLSERACVCSPILVRETPEQAVGYTSMVGVSDKSDTISRGPAVPAYSRTAGSLRGEAPGVRR